MKKFFKVMAAVVMTGVMFGMVACGGDDPKPENNDNTGGNNGGTTEQSTLAGTSWYGENNNAGTFSYQGEDYNVEMGMTMRFAESQATLQVDVNILQNPFTASGAYTIAGSQGTMEVQNQTLPFTYDATANTITITGFYLQLTNSDDNTTAQIGGDFVLRKN